MTSCDILVGDVLAVLRTLPENSVQCVVTSPPYWGLRDYGVPGQIGLEPTLEEFLAKLVEVFAEVRRVLKPDGTCWVNMGDAYHGAPSGAQGDSGQMKDREVVRHRSGLHSRRVAGLKAKDLMGQPWRVAFALQADGWWLRRDIVWQKPNPMPETVYDRPTTAHEYVFLLTKSARYFYNAEEARDPATGSAHQRGAGVNRKIVPAGWAQGPGSHDVVEHNRPAVAESGAKTRPRANASFSAAVNEVVQDRNWRSVWTIPTEPFAGAHFATFPKELARRCILAGSRAGDTVLDCFGGSGTTGAVAQELGRHCVLIELNPEYAAIARERAAQRGFVFAD